MTDSKPTSQKINWTSPQAYTMAVICLAAGIAAGWLLRGSQSPASVVAQPAEAQAAASAPNSAQPTPEEMKRMADVQAAPLLEQLKSKPDDPALLANLGNIYYDTQQFPTAIDYYNRVLKLQPANANVRTDLATAYWYEGNADGAIAEFKQALSYEPNKANALFNLGVVQWQGKMDVDGAVATWQKLLATSPNYENRDKVLGLIEQAKKHASVKPGTPAKPLS
jgi:cytochrome c-type biogenesis protein CcmH/NrfG